MPATEAPALHGVPWAQHLTGVLVAYLTVNGGSVTQRAAEQRLAAYGATWDDCDSTLFGGICAGVLTEVRDPHAETRYVLVEETR